MKSSEMFLYVLRVQTPFYLAEYLIFLSGSRRNTHLKLLFYNALDWKQNIVSNLLLT